MTMRPCMYRPCNTFFSGILRLLDDTFVGRYSHWTMRPWQMGPDSRPYTAYRRWIITTATYSQKLGLTRGNLSFAPSKGWIVRGRIVPGTHHHAKMYHPGDE
jgi:hypothetical protein